MMKLEVLASGSKGNCYLLYTSCGIIILEAGVPWKTVLKALDFDITKVICCLISHEHMDHAKYAKEYLKNGIDIIMSEGTKNALGIKTSNVITLDSKYMRGLYIEMFEIQHDASEPCGFYIENFDTGEKLIFATDTYYVQYRFPQINYIMVECNYAEDILQENIENGTISDVRINRLRESHFELSHVKDFIEENDNLNLSNVILLHLSQQNSEAERFKREISSITLAQVDIANEGLKVELGGLTYEIQ